MYLISIEGGDGSGKGLATKVIAEILEKEFTFTSVEVTGEPRRDHPLGRLAINSVRTKTMTPEGEAGLFAADRVDHSHGWILPRLEDGKVVGTITSGEWGHRVNLNLAYAFVNIDKSKEGTQMHLDLLGEMISVEVIPFSPYDESNSRILF